MRNVKRATLVEDHPQSLDLSLNVSQNFLDVPPVCALIARFASRQSLARLCSISRRFCFIFSPLLYIDTVEPPLTSTQSLRLIKTLSSPQTLSWKLHPAVLVRHLSFTSSRTNAIKSSPQEATDALMNMYQLMPDAERTRGSALRSLHWNFTAGVDELGQILNARKHFPNLTELRVTCDQTTTNFNFIQVEDLEVLGVGLEVDVLTQEDSDLADSLCGLLAKALESLPAISPCLRALHLKLKIPFSDPFPYLGLDDLVDTMNLIHLPVLTTLELSLDFYPLEIDDVDEALLPPMDFAPFLATHPSLRDLTLAAHGTILTKDIAFLPRLCSFTGSFSDAAVICAGQRQLDQLVLNFVHRAYYERPSFRTLLLPPHASLTKLTVRAVDATGQVVKMTNELSSLSLPRLVSAFPNLTHLDVCLSRRILTTVEFSVLGDNVDEGEGSSRCACGGCSDYDNSGSPGYDCEQMDSPPEMTVDYRFSVTCVDDDNGSASGYLLLRCVATGWPQPKVDEGSPKYSYAREPYVGETIQGHVELNAALAQGDSLEQLRIKFKGTIHSRIVAQTGKAAIAYRSTIMLFHTKLPLWSRGAAFPEPGTDILVFPFEFTLPKKLPPAFHCSATSRSATIRYSLEVVGERAGFYRTSRRIRRQISVVPAASQSQLMAKETLMQGWNGPWREITQEEKLTVPDMSSYPIVTAIPFKFRVQTETKPMHASYHSVGKAGKQLFPAPPAMSSDVKLILRRRAEIRVPPRTHHVEDEYPLEGSLGDAEQVAAVHQIVEEPEWIPAPGEKDEKGRGVWRRAINFEFTISIPYAPTCSTEILDWRYVLRFIVPFPGLGNNLELEVPIHLDPGSACPPPPIGISGSTTLTYTDVYPAGPPPPMLDLPPYPTYFIPEGSSG
ncbi:hypothetical protein C8F04DRAFT_1187146 [Mycena alexandri]|uniref:Arrestin-like N-terminal domain-containing protein n=1 Tax=Mycena alexandri TaxID=1745969 RepID=A0AAD6SP45_9AGAR|nr:hypothetical protein C8F04DRAFT_1187146 [Mycena alexandri]